MSSNIVGYEKLALPANAMTIMGVQFKTVGDTENDHVTLQSIKADDAFDQYGGDWIRVWDPTHQTYTTAFYWGKDADGGVYESADAAEPIGPGWGDGEQNIIDITLDHGQGFWAQSVGGGTITVSGEVSAENTVAIPANAMTIVTSTYPGELDIQKIIPTGYDQYGGDWIRIWDSATQTYTTVYYWGEDADGGVYESADADEPIGPGWGDGEQNVIQKTLDPGEGFWTQSVAGGTLAFPTAIGSGE